MESLRSSRPQWQCSLRSCGDTYNGHQQAWTWVYSGGLWESAPCQAADGTGDLGHALQAGGRGSSPLAPPPSAPMTSQVSDLTSRASPSPVSLGLILAVPACSLAWDLR